MFCKNCGENLVGAPAFCKGCGERMKNADTESTKYPQKTLSKKWPNWLKIMLIIVLFFVFTLYYAN